MLSILYWRRLGPGIEKVQATGINTISAVQRELSGRLVMPPTGTCVVFGAQVAWT